MVHLCVLNYLNPCFTNQLLVGVMGGHKHTWTGGGNEYLCLSDKPEWGKDGTSVYTYIWGVEYKSGEELFDNDNAEKLINHDAVCAVCRSARSVQVIRQRDKVSIS